MSNQIIIIQGDLAFVVKSYTELDSVLTIQGEHIVSVLSGPKGVYLKPKRIKFVGNYAIIEQREKGSN